MTKLKNMLTDPMEIEIGDDFVYEGTQYVAGSTAELSEDFTKIFVNGRKTANKTFKKLEISSFASVVIL